MFVDNWPDIWAVISSVRTREVENKIKNRYVTSDVRTREIENKIKNRYVASDVRTREIDRIKQ